MTMRHSSFFFLLATVAAAVTAWVQQPQRHPRCFNLVNGGSKSAGSPSSSQSSSLSRLYSSSGSDEPEEEGSSSSRPAAVLRFLGKGDRAIVRTGCVLVAPVHEYHHYYRKAAIFIHAMGEDDDKGGVYVVRGVILDHPTPFTVGEMIMNANKDALDMSTTTTTTTSSGGSGAGGAAGSSSAVNDDEKNTNPLAENLLFRGGDKGGDGVILLHSEEDIAQSAVGLSTGIYQGGWDKAVRACANGSVHPDKFKAFFNYCEFTEPELNSMLSGQSDDDGSEDQWMSVEVPADFVLNSDYDRGEAWSQLRNEVRRTFGKEWDE